MYRTDPEKHHRGALREVLRLYGVYGVAAQPRNAEEGLHDQSPRKRVGMTTDYPAREDGDHPFSAHAGTSPSFPRDLWRARCGT